VAKKQRTLLGESLRSAVRLYVLIGCGLVGGFIGVSLVPAELWLVGLLAGVAIGAALYFAVATVLRARR